MNSEKLSASVAAIEPAAADAATAMRHLNAALAAGTAQGGITADPGLPSMPAPKNVREQIVAEFPAVRLTFRQQQLIKTARGAADVLKDLRAKAALEQLPLNRREKRALKYGGPGTAARLMRERQAEAARAEKRDTVRLKRRLVAHFGWAADRKLSAPGD